MHILDRKDRGTYGDNRRSWHYYRLKAPASGPFDRTGTFINDASLYIERDLVANTFSYKMRGIKIEHGVDPVFLSDAIAEQKSWKGIKDLLSKYFVLVGMG